MKMNLCISISTLLVVLFCTAEVTAQLLPPFLGRRAPSTKTFENGVVSCGSTFCDPTKCSKKLVAGKAVYHCEEQ
ncbi:hypothetical protein GCK32_017810 [Trichostrongylus colubriformis]|uniref:Uncharacterized protein n=1 Tax=Trichostrongylus colubriformis TaxID=6319 RepID=A0AAN8F7S0_TRICO